MRKAEPNAFDQNERYCLNITTRRERLAVSGTETSSLGTKEEESISSALDIIPMDLKRYPDVEAMREEKAWNSLKDPEDERG
ncbi:MAG: hypothetical protein K2J70_06290 [Muribaculaceae bacterium]|nr:hypothetical protein [Muribaculaceae bacterium]